MVQFTTNALLLVGAISGVTACTGPAVNQATVDLVASFEGFRPDVCK